MEAQKAQQDYKIVELKAKIEAIDRRKADRQQVESAKREEELKYLKLQESHLTKFKKTVEEKNAWAVYFTFHFKSTNLTLKSHITPII